MEQFSSNELTVLEKPIENGKGAQKRTQSQDVAEYYELRTVIDFITSNGYKRVCLQFPDEMLPDSLEVVRLLGKEADCAVYVMADSNYESCCVDYVTAQHAGADAVVHFGPRCPSEWAETIPCLCVYEKAPMDVRTFAGRLHETFPRPPKCPEVFLKVDSPYLHLKQRIDDTLREGGFTVTDTAGPPLNIYVGENGRNLLNFQLKERIDSLYYYDPAAAEPQFAPYRLNGLLLKRRGFLIEKIRDSRRVGIVVGTLAVKDLLRAVERLKALLRLHGKRYYVLSVGRPTAAKLANFPEMDVYVAVCCPSSGVFESRDFHRPIAAVHDVEAALNGVRGAPFTYGIDERLLGAEIRAADAAGPDVSLISGGIRWRGGEKEAVGAEVAVRDAGTVALTANSGAQFLAGRTFRGLEQKLGETGATLAEEGRRGIARGYENELF